MKKHMKRLAAPKTWHIARKGAKFVTRPLPGGAGKELSMPLQTIFTEVLGYGETSRESRSIIKKQLVLVDGKRVQEERRPVGIMDTVSLPGTGEAFRMLVDRRGRLCLSRISSSDSEMKVSRINTKRAFGKGRFQLGLHDGRAVLSDNPGFVRGDSLLLKLPEQEVRDHFRLVKGAVIYLIGGKHIGSLGVVEDIRGNDLKVMIGDEVVETLKKFAFVVGRDKPAVEIAVEGKDTKDTGQG
ncbi:30S ribosomal protein S4e [Candidatus Woesearchaeota archaeon]|nr:30S ribosomal protein S4e [Candidatus Woesearchaeota archaeon]